MSNRHSYKNKLFNETSAKYQGRGQGEFMGIILFHFHILKLVGNCILYLCSKGKGSRLLECLLKYGHYIL